MQQSFGGSKLQEAMQHGLYIYARANECGVGVSMAAISVVSFEPLFLASIGPHLSTYFRTSTPQVQAAVNHPKNQPDGDMVG